jgi:hypothetical protein
MAKRTKMHWPSELGDPDDYDFGDQEPAFAFVDVAAWQSAPIPRREWAVFNRIPPQSCNAS